MIKADQIGELIHSPFSVKTEQINEIEEVIEKYPYCSTLYILQLIGLSKTKDISFENKLKLAASHVSDREHLFELVHQDTVTEETVIEEKSETEIEEVESIKTDTAYESIETADPNLQKIKPIEESLLEKANNISIDNQEETDAFPKDEAIKTKLSNQQETEQGTKVVEEVELDPNISTENSNLDSSILSHAIEVAFEHDAEELISDNETELGIEEEETEEEIVIEAKNIEEPVRTEGMSFIEWLKYKQQFIEAGTVTSEKSKKKKKKKKKVKTATKDASKKKHTTKGNSMSKKEINDLLDKFIQEEPSISRPNKEFFNPSKSAKMSLEDSSDLVSETLAKIHEMQGNYSKAISAYKQLSLLYPEKKAFFANQIKKIEDKLDD